MDFEEKTIAREEIFQGAVVHLVKDKVALPDKKGESYREIILHNGGVSVLAITPEGRIVLVKQYRKAVEEVSIEIPAGKLEPGEARDKKAAALRELEEETHYTGDLRQIAQFYSAIGFCNEEITLFLGEQLTRVTNPRPHDPDETLELLEVTLAEALELIAQGHIKDAKTIIAIQYAQLNLAETLGQSES
ncbi:NUDIX hydrolase [Streptococcus sp. DD12]|uniref:NUDIX hydrolase n=1 Tax=Streptococcus sp. DD12 TaxID=1777880 RepID=UPI00079A5D20|nr:NUDIX hydrolase [Streptococcus sp. DD12]KXT75885.1 ADP-ribose pyrophosphatase [Streptococcus sp. DD12]